MYSNVSNTTPSRLNIIPAPLLSREQVDIYRVVNFTVFGQIAAVFGMFSNAINIIVFFKMGFKESTNISLFCLAISDFISCLTIEWTNLCMTFLVMKLDLPFVPGETSYLTGGQPHVIFTRVTQCITAFIAFERCLCVTFPLKIKDLVSPTKAIVVVIGIYIGVLGSHSFMFYIYSLEWKFYPNLNKSLLGLVYTPYKNEHTDALMSWLSICLPLFTFTVVTACTIVIIVSLKRKSNWRQTATVATPSNPKQMTSHDTKVTTMVVLISTVFIVCFTPVVLTVIGNLIETENSFGQTYVQLFVLFYSVGFFFESVNAGANIFIYYFRSSNYKNKFHQTFFKTLVNSEKFADY